MLKYFRGEPMKIHLHKHLTYSFIPKNFLIYGMKIWQLWTIAMPYSSKFLWLNIFVIFVNYVELIKISLQMLQLQGLTLQNHKIMRSKDHINFGTIQFSNAHGHSLYSVVVAHSNISHPRDTMIVMTYNAMIIWPRVHPYYGLLIWHGLFCVVT